MRKKILVLIVSMLGIYAYAQDTEFWFAPPDFGSQVTGTGTDSPIYIVFSNQSKVETAHVKMELWAGNATPVDSTYIIPLG